jgi:hypothetical protein
VKVAAYFDMDGSIDTAYHTGEKPLAVISLATTLPASG